MNNKGQIPWNKGLKGVCKPNSGSFKKGERRSIETEIKKGQHLSPNTEFKKGRKAPEVSEMLRGKRSRAWKGGVIIHRDRKMIYSPNHPFSNSKGYVWEHRLVAEKCIGRYIKRNEVVHHIDGNKSNNNPENLYLFPSKSAHSFFHWNKTALVSNLV